MSDVVFFVKSNLLLSGAWVVVACALLAVYLKESLHGAKKLSVSDLTSMINNENAVVIDLRTEKEFNNGHVTGAINFASSDVNNLSLLEKKINGFTKGDASQPIVLICKEGLKSKQEAYKLKVKGIASMCYLNGGMASWTAEGMPVIN